MNDPSKRILYLGMGNDILRPMLLVPDFENITVLEMIGRSELDDVVNDITKILLNSSDEGSWYHMLYDKEYDPITIPEVTDMKYHIHESPVTGMGKWEIDIVMDGKKRKIEYYYGTDFHHPWSPDIGRFGHVMAMGAVFHARQFQSVINLLNHSAHPFFYYEGAISLGKYPTVMNAVRYTGSEIVRTTLWNLIMTYDDKKGTMADEASWTDVILACRAMMQISESKNRDECHDRIVEDAIEAIMA